MFWMHKNEFGDLETQVIENASILEGVLEIPKHSGRSTPIGVRTKDGLAVSCYIAHCGYEGIRDDLGKTAKVWLLNGIFVQIEVDGVLKITLPQRVAAQNRNVVPEVAILTSPIFLILGFFSGRRRAAYKAEGV